MTWFIPQCVDCTPNYGYLLAEANCLVGLSYIQEIIVAHDVGECNINLKLDVSSPFYP